MKPSDNEVVRLYRDEGLSIAQTSKKINMSQGFVRKALKRSGCKTRSISDGIKKAKGTDHITDEEILKLHSQGWSCEKISKHFGKSEDFARQRFIKLNIDRRDIGFYNQQRKFLNENQQKILVLDYKNGMKISDLLKKNNLKGLDTVYKCLDRYNVIKRGCAGSNNSSYRNLNYSQIIYLYCCEGYTAYEIAQEMKISSTTVYNLLKQNNIERREVKGENTSSWKGGITPLRTRIRCCAKYLKWRSDIMERDDFTCQISNNKGGKLQVHHDIPFSKIFQEFLAQYHHLDPIDDCDTLFDLAQSYNDFWDLNNGITICEEVHKKLHGDN